MEERVNKILWSLFIFFFGIRRSSPGSDTVFEKAEIRSEHIGDRTRFGNKTKQGTPNYGRDNVYIFYSSFALSCLFATGLRCPRYCLHFALVLSVFFDDYLKVVKKRNLGLRAWQKSLLQILAALCFLFSINSMGYLSTQVFIPFANMNIDFFMVLLSVCRVCHSRDGKFSKPDRRD